MDWKCVECGVETNSALMGIGGVCEAHKETVQERAREERRKLHDELRAEGLDFGDTVDFKDFERFFLKLAIHHIEYLALPENKKLYAQIKRNNPLFLIPEEMALLLKEKVIHLIPEQYVSVVTARGHERLFHGGTFEFKQAIPGTTFKAILLKAGVVGDDKSKGKKKGRKAS